jgi:hypothetical protein
MLNGSEVGMQYATASTSKYEPTTAVETVQVVALEG